MNRRIPLTLTAMALLALAVCLPAGNSVAQEKQHVSFKNPAENSKYKQRVNLNVADVPNHIMRAYEIHRTYPSNGPIHVSKATLAALAERAHWLTVEWLPKYAPELNDIEVVLR